MSHTQAQKSLALEVYELAGLCVEPVLAVTCSSYRTMHWVTLLFDEIQNYFVERLVAVVKGPLMGYEKAVALV